MVLAENKAKHLSSVKHITKTIHHHQFREEVFVRIGFVIEKPGTIVWRVHNLFGMHLS